MHKKTKIRQTFSSLKIRNFRLFITGQIISTTGTWMQTIGQAWLVLKLTNSGTALGLVIALQFLPVLIIGPWGGVITDRFSKRNLLFITQSVCAVLALILGILVATNFVQLWMVYVLALCLGLVNAVDSPARQTFIPEMVDKENLLSAVSLNSMQGNLTRVIGPSIAAILIAAFGLAPLFFFNALSYMVVIIALSMMDIDKLDISPYLTEFKGQLKEGLRYVRSSPVIFHTLLMMAIIGTFTYEFSVSLPLLAQFTFHGTATTYALLSSALGFGSIFGSLNTANRKKINFSILTQNAFLFGLSVFIFALATSFPLALFLIILVGFFSFNFLSLVNVILQMESKPTMRGRVMSLWAVAFLGSTPLGGPIVGWVSQHAGPRFGLMVGAVAALIASGIGIIAVRNHKSVMITKNAEISEKNNSF
jgi:MFS family permease